MTQQLLYTEDLSTWTTCILSSGCWGVSPASPLPRDLGQIKALGSCLWTHALQLVGRNYPGITLVCFWQRVTGWNSNGYIPVELCSSYGSGSWTPALPIHPVGSLSSESNMIPLSDWPEPLHLCVFTASEAKREFVEAGSSLCFLRLVLASVFTLWKSLHKWLCPNHCTGSVIARTNIPFGSTYRLGQESHNWCFAFHCLI